MRVGMIGTGIIAKSHATALAEVEGVELAAVADIVEEKARRYGEEWKVPYYTDYHEMIAKEKLDIALINLPHGLHMECAVFCAQQGLHTFLEKPMANTSEQCEAIRWAFEKSGKTLMIGHIQRYIAENRLAKQLIDSGKYGEIVTITDTRNIDYFHKNRPAWFLNKELAGGGIVMNFGAHTLDKLQYLTGLDVTAVNGKINQHINGISVEGDAQFFVQLGGGKLAALASMSGYKVPPQNETMIYLTNGVIRLHTGLRLWVSDGGEFLPLEPEGKGQEFVLMWQEFVHCLKNGKQPLLNAAYGRGIIARIEQLYQMNSM